MDGSNNLTFTDAVTGTKTLAELAAGGVGGEWTASGDDIYWNGIGNVGIGTCNPVNPNTGIQLIVNSTIPGIDLKSTTGNSANTLAVDAYIFSYTNDDTPVWKICSYDGGSDDLVIHNYRNADIHLDANNSTKMIIKNTGNVGIGITVPYEKLEVAGAITVSDGGYSGISDGATTPVPAGGAGTIVFLSTHFYGWDGSAWQQLD